MWNTHFRFNRRNTRTFVKDILIFRVAPVRPRQGCNGEFPKCGGERGIFLLSHKLQVIWPWKTTYSVWLRLYFIFQSLKVWVVFAVHRAGTLRGHSNGGPPLVDLMPSGSNWTNERGLNWLAGFLSNGESGSQPQTRNRNTWRLVWKDRNRWLKTNPQKRRRSARAAIRHVRVEIPTDVGDRVSVNATVLRRSEPV